MTTFGHTVLIISLIVSLYAIAASLYGVRTGAREWIVSGRRAIYALAGLLTIAMIVLESAFLRSDFSFGLVADNSSTTMSAFYKLTAMWASQSGSLLLWVWMLSIFSSIALAVTKRRLREIAPYATAVLGGLAAFFLVLVVFKASPFTHIATPPVEGVGLNPLLRNPSMMFHPLLLFAGYVGWSIPFAFAIGALITRRLDAQWIRSTRIFSLAAWTFLSAGVLLGARWSYAELGWGGYWGWDAVENASLLPWLVGTAFLHSIIVQEKRNMLKVWNMSLIVATFTLVLLGTFLVRSGILSSIHAFGASTIGGFFLAMIVLVLVVSTALIVSRLDDLRSDQRSLSLFSREAVFLVNNLVLVGLTFVVLWGTLFPLIAEALTGTKSSVGPPWFDRYTVPLAIVLVLLTGITPLLAWGRATPKRMARMVMVPAIAAAAVLVLIVLFTPVANSPTSLIMFTFAGFVLATIIGEFWRGIRARRIMSTVSWGMAFVTMVRRNQRRYGGYIVHVGIVVMFLGVAASSAFDSRRDVNLAPGKSTSIGSYDVRYVKPTATVTESDHIDLGAVLDVSKDGKRVALLRPMRSYYTSSDPSLGAIGRFFRGEATSEIGLKTGFRRDIWSSVKPNLRVLNGSIDLANRRFADSRPEVQATVIGVLMRRYLDAKASASFRLIVSPMVTWIWVGGLIVLFGALIALWPTGQLKRRRIVASLRVEQLGRKPSSEPEGT